MVLKICVLQHVRVEWEFTTKHYNKNQSSPRWYSALEVVFYQYLTHIYIRPDEYMAPEEAWLNLSLILKDRSSITGLTRQTGYHVQRDNNKSRQQISCPSFKLLQDFLDQLDFILQIFNTFIGGVHTGVFSFKSTVTGHGPLCWGRTLVASRITAALVKPAAGHGTAKMAWKMQKSEKFCRKCRNFGGVTKFWPVLKCRTWKKGHAPPPCRFEWKTPV
jgi:hypothetical protein